MKTLEKKGGKRDLRTGGKDDVSNFTHIEKRGGGGGKGKAWFLFGGGSAHIFREKMKKKKGFLGKRGKEETKGEERKLRPTEGFSFSQLEKKERRITYLSLGTRGRGIPLSAREKEKYNDSS